MGAGREGASDRLGVDIALIGKRQPTLFESAANIADLRACAHDDAPAIEVGADESPQVLQAEQLAAGRDDRGEGMTGAGHSDREILTRGLMHECSQFVFRTRLGLVPGDGGLIANPVTPVPALPQPRRRPSNIIHVAISSTAPRARPTRAAGTQIRSRAADSNE